MSLCVWLTLSIIITVKISSKILKSIKYFFLNGVQINKEHVEGYMETQCDKVIGLFNQTR